ncbi:MAG: 3-oxoacyl-[acyl-carrier-protein] synthase III C-terminal domain-containing protein [Myxococcota bacterium]
MTSVGITALSIAHSATVRDNAYWESKHPQMVEAASEHALAKLWAPTSEQSTFDRAMAPYGRDPFKGAKRRRVSLSPDASVDLHADAATSLLEAWSGSLCDIDFAIVSSLRPDTIGAGDAAWLARRLGLRCPAINVETACASAVMGLDLACSMVETGRASRILVSASCTYARDIPETNSLAWFLGDGAGAFIVERSDAAAVPLGTHRISTQQTCGAFVHELVLDDAGAPALRMRATRGAGAVLHDTAEPFLREACEGALRSANVSLDAIDLCVFNTPTAWYADFCADTLGVPRSKTISVYPETTNIGPALMSANLHRAVATGRLHPGDLVLIYAVGSASTAIATVVQWGEVALGSPSGP